MYDIRPVTGDKKKWLDLLLLGDEDEAMIDLYLDRSSLYVLMEEGDAASLCAVTRESPSVIEIKNLATRPESQGRGYATALIDYVEKKYAAHASVLRLGTGETPEMLQFYARRGFVFSHRLPHFFRDNYAHPVIDNGILLDDMIVLQKPLGPGSAASNSARAQEAGPLSLRRPASGCGN